MNEQSTLVILVNPKDKKIGLEEKIMAHRYGMLHRAFSVLIFRENQGKKELLLQQRNKDKYHSGGLWTNTCCSHPKQNERNLLKAAQNRLKEEMGISVLLHKKGMFHYIAQFDNGLCENELDHVFVGTLEAEAVIRINPDEVADYQWVEIDRLKKDLKDHPEKYTPWLGGALDVALLGG